MSFEFEAVLEHYGIKGMKWGVRRSRKQIDAASEDATRAAAAKEKAKKSGTQSLSNKELQALVTRMNLEQQYSRLQSSNPTGIAKGAKTAQSILKAGRTMNDVMSFANSPAGKMLKSELGDVIVRK